jgi:hypothetical protein
MPEIDSPKLKTEIITELLSKLLLALPPCAIYPSDPLFCINPPLLCCHQVDFVLVWFSLLPRQFFPSLSPTDALAGCCLCTGNVHH